MLLVYNHPDRLLLHPGKRGGGGGAAQTSRCKLHTCIRVGEQMNVHKAARGRSVASSRRLSLAMLQGPEAGSLHAAAMAGDTGALDAGLAQGLQLNARDPEGCSPLHWAADKGHSQVGLFLFFSLLPALFLQSASPTPGIFISKSLMYCFHTQTWD